MGFIRISVIALLVVNLLLLGVRASQPPAPAVIPAIDTPLRVSGTPTIVMIHELEGLDDADLTRQCFTVGPFESDVTAEAIVEMLSGNASSAQARKTEAFVDRGYWVYLPPFESEREARQAVSALYDAGHDDVSLMFEGEFNLSVSLGYFINQSNASQLIEKVRKLGFEARMRIQRDDESRFWVDYEQMAGVEYASRMLAEFVPETLHRTLSCPGTPESEPELSEPGQVGDTSVEGESPGAGE